MKRFFLLFAIVIIFNSIHAQILQWQWANKGQLAASTSFDLVSPLGIAKDNAGNFYATGAIQSASITFGSYVLTNGAPGSNNFIFLVKYDASGNLLWAKRFTNNSSSSAYGIAVDAACNIYLTGLFGGTYNFDNITLNFAGLYDGFITKLDSSGNVIWAKSFGGTGTERGVKINVDSQQNIYVFGGFTSNSFTIGSQVLPCLGSYDFFVAKYDSAGHVLWAKSGGGNQVEDVTAMDVDVSGNCAVLGTFQSDSIMIGNQVLHRVGTTDIFIAKYDSSGNVLWARRESKPNFTYPQSITIDGAANTYIAGDFTASSYIIGNDTLVNNSVAPYMHDCFLVKYFPSGNPDWAIGYGGQGLEAVGEITKDNNGDIIVPGYYNSPMLNFGNNVSVTNSDTTSLELYVVKFNASGNAIAASTTANAGNDMFQYSAVYMNNNFFDFIAIGSFNPPSYTWGPITLNTTQRSFYFAKAGGLLTGIPLQSESFEKMIFYPNPVRGELSVTGFPLSERAELQIYNILGEKVLNQELKANSQWQTIDVSSLVPGIYVVKVFSGEKMFVKKIVKM